MAKRLSFDGYDGSKPVAIPGVPAPLHADGRAHSLARVLEIALAHLGLPLGYDAIMGLCGLAFRTPPWPDAPSLTAAESCEAVKALSDTLGGCMRILRADESPDRGEVVDAVAASVDTGRPCMAFGWGSDRDHWSVITGYDRGKERLIGHCLLDAPRRQYESWPPTLEVLVVMVDDPRPRGPQAVTDALLAGARRWSDEGAARYAVWVEAMRALEQPPGTAHEQAVELLADARAAAAGFAGQVAEREREIPAAWLSRAAEQWRELVRLLEARGVPHSLEALMAVETQNDREDWARMLEAAAEIEGKAVASVRLSATVDYLPSEAQSW
ncbi:MAG: hypothetical protein ACOCX2_04255 [Armatimonadota bacterium]